MPLYVSILGLADLKSYTALEKVAFPDHERVRKSSSSYSGFAALHGLRLESVFSSALLRIESIIHHDHLVSQVIALTLSHSSVERLLMLAIYQAIEVSTADFHQEQP